MVAKKEKRVSLTDGELDLLSLLWQQGELSLSEAHERFSKSIGYTTMQTRLNRLVEKGLVRRSDSRPTRYSAVIAPAEVSASQLDDLVNQVTKGSVVPLVAQLIGDRALSTNEIDEIKQLIEQAEKNAMKGKGKK